MSGRNGKPFSKHIKTHWVFKMLPPRRPQAAKANEPLTASEVVLSNSTCGGEGCWEWTAYKDKKGYGRCGSKHGEVLAHRISHIVFNGPIPSGLHVLHSCDNPSCVNPAHLRVGTNDDNVMDRHERNRWASMPGDKNPNAKLTWDEVRKIRADNRSQSKIGDVFGVSQITVSLIKRGKIWKE
jgi:hypothetical protein